MGLPHMFESFLKDRPICVMARATLERLREAERINELFARVTERQYTQDLLFSQLVELMSEVTLGWQRMGAEVRCGRRRDAGATVGLAS